MEATVLLLAGDDSGSGTFNNFFLKGNQFLFTKFFSLEDTGCILNI